LLDPFGLCLLIVSAQRFCTIDSLLRKAQSIALWRKVIILGRFQGLAVRSGRLSGRQRLWLGHQAMLGFLRGCPTSKRLFVLVKLLCMAYVHLPGFAIRQGLNLLGCWDLHLLTRQKEVHVLARESLGVMPVKRRQ